MKKYDVSCLILLSIISFFYVNSNSWACGAKRSQVEVVSLQQRLIDPGFSANLHSGAIAVPLGGQKICLSPPWWMIRSELVNSIGATPGVTVGAPEVISAYGRKNVTDFSESELAQIQSSLFSIEVHASTIERARALALVLKPLYQAGTTSVSVWVSGPDNPGVAVPAAFPISGVDLTSFVQDQLVIALNGNPYFLAFTQRRHQPLMPAFFMIFSREEIQFYADNIGDAYRNMNYVAADVFSEVLNLVYFNGIVQVGVSTAEKNTHYAAWGISQDRPRF